MVYKAIVIDNSSFYKNGTIRIKIQKTKEPSQIDWELSLDYPRSIENVDLYEAKLSGAFGGGRNYGALILPQVNETGIVAFLDDGDDTPIWLGGLFEGFFADEASNLASIVNSPTDFSTDGFGNDGVINGEPNLKNPSQALNKNIIIRTKSTSRKSKDGLNWNKRPTSNLITVGDDEMILKHFFQGNGWEKTSRGFNLNSWGQIKFKDGSVSLDYENKRENLNVDLALSEQGFEVKTRDEENSGNLEVTNNGIYFGISDFDENCTVDISKQSFDINIFSDSSSLEKSTEENREILRIQNEEGDVISKDLDVYEGEKTLYEKTNSTEEETSRQEIYTDLKNDKFTIEYKKEYLNEENELDTKLMDEIQKENDDEDGDPEKQETLNMKVDMDFENGIEFSINEKTKIKIVNGEVIITAKSIKLNSEELKIGAGTSGGHLVSTTSTGTHTMQNGLTLTSHKNTHI